MDIIRAQEQSRDLHEQFHHQLERAQDGFSVIADYYGRGVFNKVLILLSSSAVLNERSPDLFIQRLFHASSHCVV